MSSEVNQITALQPVVKMTNITKMFGDFKANDNINFDLLPGEVHALLGENGAGKSTLMNILYGVHRPTSGDIFLRGEKVKIKNSNIAIEHGIGMVHQHFMLVEPFTVTQNIVLGKEPSRWGFCFNEKKARQDILALSEKFGLHVEPDAVIHNISVGMQQRVEILKALYRGADILILDEPTAVLTPQEILDLNRIIRSLTQQGKSIVIITHKLKEIKSMADRCTIIRRGHFIDTVKVSDVTEEELASKMVGHEVHLQVDKQPKTPGSEILRVENLKVLNERRLEVVKGLSLSVRSGEIVGVAGVDGNGQTEFVDALMGLRKVESGKVLMNGADITGTSPRTVLNHKIAMVPADRQKRGLVLDFSLAENFILQNYAQSRFSKFGRLLFSNIQKFSQELLTKFDVRPCDEKAKAKDLSGGNQQKVILAREITSDPDLLIAVQPTRGLDVGAIEFIHKSIVAQRDRGKAVLLVSLELDEVLNLSDRIAVIYEGKIVDIIPTSEADENKIGLLMAGGKAHA